VATTRAESHRTEQAALGSLLADLIAHAWARLVDTHNLKGSSPRLTVAVEAIVKKYGAASASHALAAYRQQRRDAGIPGRPALRMPESPSHDEIVRVVESTLHDLYGTVTPESEAKVQDALTAEVEQLVLDQGRRATIDAAEADKEAKGWARVPEPDACSFCALLSTRGAVYKTRESASFEAHPNCRCNVEPLFNAYEPSAEIRQWQADYKRLADEYGHSGRGIHVAWRQHIEGRPVTGPLVKPYTRSK
jgi:hypothetical protein